MSRIAEIWQRIESVLELYDPKRLEGLREGATQTNIQALEREIAMELPKEFKESLSIHDGQESRSSSILGGAWELLSTSGALTQIRMYRELTQDKKLSSMFLGPSDGLKDTAKIKNIYWNSCSVPIGDNSGNHFLLDLDPEPKGTYGQVIQFTRAVGPERVVAQSFADWLEKYAKRYERRFLSKQN